jgi:hypothetical protein
MKITRSIITYVEVDMPDTLEKFKDWQFTSGGDTGPDFFAFAKLFKAKIKGLLGKTDKTMKIVRFDKGHYEIYGCIEKDGKFVYFNVSDVRFWPGAWYKLILIRTATGIKDYTGGRNEHTALDNFGINVANLMTDEPIEG